MQHELDRVRDLAQDRLNKAVHVGYAHVLTAEKYKRLHLWFGIPVIFISAILGTSFFANLRGWSKGSIAISIFVAVLSLSAAILSGLQTFFDSRRMAVRHIQSARLLYALARKIDHILLLNESSEMLKQLKALDKEFNQKIETSLQVSSRTLRRASESGVEASRRQAQLEDAPLYYGSPLSDWWARRKPGL